MRIASNRVVVVEEDRGQALAHVPFQIIRQHAQQHMGAHPGRGPMIDRAQFQIDGFD